MDIQNFYQKLCKFCNKIYCRCCENIRSELESEKILFLALINEKDLSHYSKFLKSNQSLFSNISLVEW